MFGIRLPVSNVSFTLLQVGVEIPEPDESPKAVTAIGFTNTAVKEE